MKKILWGGQSCHLPASQKIASSALADGKTVRPTKVRGSQNLRGEARSSKT
jgi:hypothetical protein